jgi:hypothetical protein
MAVWRSTHVSKKTGEVRVYEYHYDYYVTAEERALAILKKRPLQRVRKANGGLAYKWTAGARGPVFHDATIVRLIKKGKAVCFGDFVERKGIQR